MDRPTAESPAASRCGIGKRMSVRETALVLWGGEGGQLRSTPRREPQNDVQHQHVVHPAYEHEKPQQVPRHEANVPADNLAHAQAHDAAQQELHHARENETDHGVHDVRSQGAEGGANVEGHGEVAEEEEGAFKGSWMGGGAQMR